MGRNVPRVRGSFSARSGAGVVLAGAPQPQLHEVPPRFATVGEALASDPAAPTAPASTTLDACAVVGQALAHEGVPLDEVLDGLRATARLVTGAEPAYAAVRALAGGWSEATLGYLHRLSCEDPLTGLATAAHLRSRLAELYRDQEHMGLLVQETHVLVVLETPAEGRDDDPFGAALRTARLAETVCTVFTGGHTVARVGRERVALLGPRDEHLGRRMGVLRSLLRGIDPPVRTWLAALPGDEAGAAAVLHELARR